MCTLSIFKEQRGKMCLSGTILANAGLRAGMVRACSGAPVLSPLSPLTPGCREPVQFHRDPPRSFGTCMWYRYPTPNRKHKSAEGHTPADSSWGPGQDVSKATKHRNKETGCHLGTCLPGSQAEISLSRKGNLLQRVRLMLTRHWTAADIISLSSSAFHSPGQHNTLNQRSSSQAPASAIPTPS